MYTGLLIAVLSVTPVGSTEEPHINSTNDRAEMAAALRDAKRAFPTFLQALQKGTASSFFVKVRVPCPDAHDVEFIWVGDVTIDGGEFIGRYANASGCRSDIRIGTPLRFKRRSIVDWYFMRDGRMHGSYSTRVLLKDMPPDEVEEINEILAPLPE